MLDHFHGDEFTKDEQEMLRKMRSTNIKLQTGVQSMKDINKRDEFLINLNQVRAEFSNKNKSGKSFYGIEEFQNRLIEIKGDKQLFDNSSGEIYKKWYFNIECNSLIAITNEGEKEIKFENVVIID